MSEFHGKLSELDELQARIEELSREFLLMSKRASVPAEQRHASKIVHNRLNVSAFEIRHCKKLFESLPSEHEEEFSGTLF